MVSELLSVQWGLGWAARERRLALLVGVAAALLAASAALALTWDAPGGAGGQEGAKRGLETLPEAARAPVSQSLGRGDGAYHARRTPAGLGVTNRAHRVRGRFTADGVRVRSGAARLGLTFSGVGYGEALRAPLPAMPTAGANRVAYRRGALTEWYVNGPLGLEQGFTLRSRPAGPKAGPLTLGLDLSGNLRAGLDPGRDGLTLQGAGASLRYAGLVAHDARGRELPAWLELDGRRVLVRVEDTSARYPLTIDPFVQQAKLTASDGAEFDSLGDSVAVSGDTVVVGAPDDNVGANENQGSAYVFVKPAAGWAGATETAKLTASDGAANDLLGNSVAVSGDTVVAGTLGLAAAYVFVKPAAGWADATETAKLTASDPAVPDLGFSVAVSGDTVVAGAPLDEASAGSAYVFVKPAAGWADATETAKLTASDGAGAAEDDLGDRLGFSVAVSGDTVVAGAPLDDVGANAEQGSAYVFVKPAAGWANANETAKLTASDGAAIDQLGNSVAVSGDTVAAGAYGAEAGAGSAYVFVKPAAGWAGATETAKLTASDGAAGDQLGRSVAVSGDTVVAGALFDDVGANDQGSAYVFVEPAAGWADATETEKLTASDGAADDFLGDSVAVSGDTVVAGAPFDDVGANAEQGSAYVFVDVPPNQPPSCVGVSSSPGTIFPARRDQFELINLSGATDADGDPLSFTIDAVTQDEPVSGIGVGDNTSPDAQLTAAGASSNQVLVRSERNPMQDGRVYRIAYTVSDNKGASCSRTAGVGGDTNAEVAVPRTKDEAAVDDGNANSWNSFTGDPVLGTLP